MNDQTFNTWQAVQAEVLRRIQTREWQPGASIPKEADLAAEMGCARSTVNRALRALSDEGLIERRRKAGSRVALHPTRRATLEIPMIRADVEAQGKAYSFSLIAKAAAEPPLAIKARMQGMADTYLRVQSLHLADGLPYLVEDRWINTSTVPAASKQEFRETNPNEWLLTHAPYTHGEIAFGARAASPHMSALLGCEAGASCFTSERITWINDQSVTLVTQIFTPGHRMVTQI